ncbi:MAG: AraC family transcriptional regulator, partial [Bacteroidota bacterium]
KEITSLKLAKEILENRLINPPSILELSKLVGLNTCKLKTGFKKLFGITIRQYLINLRMEMARDLIKNTDHPISYICHMVGYSNRGHFAALYQKYFGSTPVRDR